MGSGIFWTKRREWIVMSSSHLSSTPLGESFPSPGLKQKWSSYLCVCMCECGVVCVLSRNNEYKNEDAARRDNAATKQRYTKQRICFGRLIFSLSLIFYLKKIQSFNLMEHKFNLDSSKAQSDQLLIQIEHFLVISKEKNLISS